MQFMIFGLGCLTAPALLYLQDLWDKYPRFNLVSFIESNFQAEMIITIFIYLLFASMEEIIKLFVVKIVDEKTLLIKRVNDAIRYSLAAALGFSFTENIYYIYVFWPHISEGELIGMFIFRSIFTTAAHLAYSGIFGYHYGIGKFSMVVSEHESLTGGVGIGTKIISKIFNLPVSEGFRQKTIFRGLVIAIMLHFAINYLLELQYIIPVIIITVAGFIFLQLLLSRKAGHLVLRTDPSTMRPATIAKKDKDVVVELLGMWFKEGKYVDVMHICERLLERDPDNRVVKLFQARAMDEMDEHNVYKKILGTVLKTNTDLNEHEKNIIDKYTEEKEMFQKVKQMIKKQLEKEGKTWVEPKLKAAPIIMAKEQETREKVEEKTYKL
ncbi:PrsW family intramembrane metalloprotease [Candidatus Peregrinibacteria bacterium]|nr:PrsW family intramembrane metalloprotease [Candidatus Peregrinibacteria bacterium]